MVFVSTDVVSMSWWFVIMEFFVGHGVCYHKCLGHAMEIVTRMFVTCHGGYQHAGFFLQCHGRFQYACLLYVMVVS